jgi:hypothetical protein
VGPYGSLTLGPNPVHIGTWDGRVQTLANGAGLACDGLPWAPGYVVDTGHSTLQIDSQLLGVAVGNYCQATLTHGPTIGRDPDGGYNSCPDRLTDHGGISVVEGGSATIGSPAEPATIQCQRGDGLVVDAMFNTSVPTVYFAGTVRNIACNGLDLQTGRTAVFDTRISYCHTGVWVNAAATADLSGGAFGLTQGIPPSRIFCISHIENEGGAACSNPDQPGQLSVAGSALANYTSSTVFANNVLWASWDPIAQQPPVWACKDDTVEQCTCQSGDCPDSGPSEIPLAFDTTAVYLVGNPQPFSFDGGGLYNPPCE